MGTAVGSGRGFAPRAEQQQQPTSTLAAFRRVTDETWLRALSPWLRYLGDGVQLCTAAGLLLLTPNNQPREGERGHRLHLRRCGRWNAIATSGEAWGIIHTYVAGLYSEM